MTSEQKTELILQLICGLLIFIFTYTACSKLMNYLSFQATLAASPLIGKNKAFAFAVALPFVEIVAVLFLSMPLTRKTGLYLSLVLMAIFTVYVGYMLLFASSLPCSCGGIFKWMTWNHHLFFNIFFFGLSLLAVLIIRKYPDRGLGFINHFHLNAIKIIIAIIRKYRTPVK